MTVLKYLMPVAFLLQGATLCQAQFDAKPGLWETTTSTQSASGVPTVPPEVLARLTPEQRAQMEAGMKGRMNGPKGNGTTTRSCITKEQLSKPFPFGDEREKSCKREMISSTRNHQEIRVECEEKGNKTVGTVKIEATSPETFTGSMVMNTTLAESRNGGGRAMDIKMSFTGKWIGSDCGDVKPSTR